MNARDESMAGRVCLITGATSGIGRETARGLAAKGATVVLAGRDRGKAESAVERISRETGNPSVEYLLADLSVQDEVHRLVEQFNQRHDHLHVLVNNAGGFFLRRQETVDGIEMTFALNYLAPYLLTLLLLGALRRGAPSRIVNVSSRAHRHARLDPEKLDDRRRYSGWQAYGRSKLALLLFTYELARCLKGSDVTVNALHPGFVATGIGIDGHGPLRALLGLAQRIGGTSAERGAESSIYLASSPEVEAVTGRYFAGRQPVASSPASYDRENMKRMWEISAELTHLPMSC